MPDLKKFMDQLDQKVTDICGMVKVLEDDDIPAPKERYEPRFGPNEHGLYTYHYKDAAHVLYI